MPKSQLSDSSKKYFDFSKEKIGSSFDIVESIDKATQYYLDKGMFIGLASQKVRKGKLRTDFVAYDYLADIQISVEIESSEEVRSHPEHVLFNM